MNATAVIIARFQTPYLHDGHQYLINQIRSKHNKVVVVLGVSPVKGSKRNPFDFYTRERMIKKLYSDLVVLPLPDHPSDKVWSSNLDQLLKTSFPNESFLLFGSRDSFIQTYTGLLPVQELPEIASYSATEIRNETADKVVDSTDFRMGINYAYNNTYPVVYPTVDIALFKDNRDYLLLGRKQGRNGWRLPGGFVDVTDHSFEAAAKRELFEECGDIETSSIEYVGSAQIDDWRYRAEANKIMTTLFSTELLYGEAQAGDDLTEVKWFRVDNLYKMLEEEQITPEHIVLIDMLLQHEQKTTTKNFK